MNATASPTANSTMNPTANPTAFPTAFPTANTTTAALTVHPLLLVPGRILPLVVEAPGAVAAGGESGGAIDPKLETCKPHGIPDGCEMELAHVNESRVAGTRVTTTVPG